MFHKFLFYVEDLEEGQKIITLGGGEHHHLKKVLRIGHGENVYVSNGRGRIFKCEVASSGAGKTELVVIRQIQANSNQKEITLALGCIKKERFERAVAQCTELGMTKCVPFISANSPVQNYSERFLQRLRAIALSSMKQSFRSVLPDIEPPADFASLIERIKGAELAIAGSQTGPPLWDIRWKEQVMLVVGPEAGFTAAEMDLLAKAGTSFYSVSPSRLRSETAAAAMLAIISAFNE